MYISKKYGFSLLIALICLTSCDIIPENERLLVVDNLKTVRPVLLEDFTGQACRNCPLAAAKAKELKSALGDNLIIVSIHAGSFATSSFRTEAGDAYQKYFYENDITGYPAGMIDRSIANGSIVSTNFSTWGTTVLNRAQLLSVPTFNLDLDVDYNTSNQSLTIKASGEASEAVNDINIQLWLTESKIIAPQLSGDEQIRDYEHNHVLRDAINGIWGESIEMKPDNNTFNYVFSGYSLVGKSWKLQNMHIVAFLYNTSNREVLHVIEVPLN